MMGFILTVALVNTGVGFALAVYLGWRHRHLLTLEMDSSASFPISDLFPPVVPATAADSTPGLDTASEPEMALSQEAIDSAVDSVTDSAADLANDTASEPAMDADDDSAVDSATDSAVDSTADSAVDAHPTAGATDDSAPEAATDPAAHSAADGADESVVGPRGGSSAATAADAAARSAADSAPASDADAATGSTDGSAVDATLGSARGSAVDSAANSAARPAVDSAVDASASSAARPASGIAADAARQRLAAAAASPSESALKRSPVPGDPSPATREREPAEIAMNDLRGHIYSFQEQVLDIDGLLRQLSRAQTPDVPKVEQCVKTFQDASDRYLKASGESYENLQKPQAGKSLDAPALEELRAAVDAQTQRIESAQAAMKSIDYQGDLAQTCRQMSGQTAQVASASHALRDILDRAWSAATRVHKWTAPAHEPLSGGGMLVGLADQPGLEAALARWRETEAQSTKLLCMAAIDLDRFGRINEKYGPRTGDRLLHALAQLLVREGSHNNIVGRVSGQRFVVLFPETDLRLTTSVVERIRQIVEMAHFYYGDDDIRVTVCCAVIEAKPQDDLAAMLGRADAAIQEAKRYGRNRTFLYEGEYPTPVVPPNFALEEKSITL